MTRIQMMLGVSCFASVVASVPMAALPARAADNPADFYKDKQVRLIISSPVGGGYNRYARTVARHIGAHIPGSPTIIAQNMPGAGGLKAANYLYNVAPQDGSEIGTLQNTVLFEPLYGNHLAKFDAEKFNWLGSANSEVAMIVVWHTAPVNTIEDLQKTEISVGATGAASTPAFFGRLFNSVLDTKMNIIVGYKGMSGAFQAMESGEVQGFPSTFYSSLKSRWGQWLEQKKVRILVQLALEKHPALPEVALAQDLVSDQGDEDLLNLAAAPLTIGRPSLAPPGTPETRVTVLREALLATMKDPGYLKNAKKQGLETGNFLTGERIAEIVGKTYQAPKSAVERLTAINKELQAKEK